MGSPPTSSPMVRSLLLVALATTSFARAQCVGCDVPYAEVPGVDASLLSLDVYVPDAPAGAPVVVYVHGGGWSGGDKVRVGAKAAWLTEQGAVFVSVNYRLSPSPPDPDAPGAVRHPVHARDAAAAIAYVYREIDRYGGDPARISLLGHSAGAHLVALVGTDPRLLGAHGLAPSDLQAVVALDTNAYDVPFLLARDGGERGLYLNAFTTDPTVWADASPISHVGPDPLPSFVLVHQGTPLRQATARRFLDRLTGAGHAAATFDAGPLSHLEINGLLGTGAVPDLDAIVLGTLAPPRGTAAERGPDARPDVWPNPARASVTVWAGAGGRIRLFDARGRLVRETEGAGRVRVDLRDLPPGAYTVEVGGRSRRIVHVR